MIPKNLIEYVKQYPHLWNKTTLCNFNIDPNKPDDENEKLLANHIFNKGQLITNKYHGKQLNTYNKYRRMLYLAPVGNQCFVDVSKVWVIVAGLSTSKQAAYKFYTDLTNENDKFDYKNATANASYYGKMRNRFIERINKFFDFYDICKKISESTFSEKGSDILFTQRIKDASLGYKHVLLPTTCDILNIYSDSSSNKFNSKHFDINSVEMKPFIDEIETIIYARGSKIPILILLGNSNFPSTFIKPLIQKKYFEKIYWMTHPSPRSNNKSNQGIIV
jgi:hypothetical protein